MGRVALVTGGSRGIGAAICDGAEGRRLHGRGELRRQRRGGEEVHRRDRHQDLQVVGRRLRRLRRRHQAGRGRPRPGRGAGQQRRHHPRRAVPQDDARAVAGGHRHQPLGRLQHDPPGLAGHARPQVRPDRHHLVGQRPEGPVRPGQLLGGQGRRHRLLPRAGAGGRAQQHHRQRHRAGLYRHRDGDGRAREGPRVDHRPDPGRPPRRGRRRSPGCVVFLASDAAGFITGSTISANGGQFFS